MYAKYIKRILDFVLSLMALIVLSPLLVILIILGAVFMRGNPFFTQARPGKDEKIFKLIKFRTMDNRKDKDGKLLPDDVRLNKYGRILRSTSLDELPELINILIGDMSIVGPRPLTGYAQVHGRNNVNWDERIKLDIVYVDNISFVMDLKVFIDTVLIVLKREGIGTEGMSNFDDYRKKQWESQKQGDQHEL